MGFSNYLEINKRLRPIIDILGTNFVTFNINEGKLKASFSTIPQSKINTMDWAHQNTYYKFFHKINTNILSTIESYLCFNTILNGPKLINVNEHQCLSMEHTDVNIKFDDYNQPFPTVVVNLPYNYTKLREFDVPEKSSPMIPDRHQADFSIIHWQPSIKLLLITNYFSSGQCFSLMLWSKTGRETIEECLNECCVKIIDKSLKTSDDEIKASLYMSRIAINTCLLATMFNVQRNGPLNKSLNDRLERYVCNKDINKQIEARRRLKEQPICYSFDQNIQLRNIRYEKKDYNHSGITVASHWRRGHYCHQVYGPKRLLRKLIFIKPILVNAHLFGGNLSMTNVNYNI